MRILILFYTIRTVVLLPMSMDRIFYTIMYNANSCMYHEPRHEIYIYNTSNTIIIELNSI